MQTLVYFVLFLVFTNTNPTPIHICTLCVSVDFNGLDLFIGIALLCGRVWMSTSWTIWLARIKDQRTIMFSDFIDNKEDHHLDFGPSWNLGYGIKHMRKVCVFFEFESTIYFCNGDCNARWMPKKTCHSLYHIYHFFVGWALLLGSTDVSTLWVVDVMRFRSTHSSHWGVQGLLKIDA